MQKQPVGAQGPKIDITKTTPIVCDNEECENDMFMKAMKFRKVSKLMTGQPQDGILPVDFINSRLDDYMTKRVEKDEINPTDLPNNLITNES